MDKSTDRFIGANELKEAVKAWVNMDAYYSNKSPRSIKTIPISEVISLIDDAPTLEKGKKLKRGEWVKMSDRYGEYFACNECGYDREKAKGNYCSNCGALMTKEV